MSLTKDFDQESYLISRRPSEGFVLSIDPQLPLYKIQICNKSEQKKMRRETETIIPESLLIPPIRDDLTSLPLSRENSSLKLLPRVKVSFSSTSRIEFHLQSQSRISKESKMMPNVEIMKSNIISCKSGTRPENLMLIQ